MRPASGSGQRGFGVLALLLVIVAVVVVAATAVTAISALRVSDARRGWDRTFGSWDEVMARYPATDANAAALELEQLAAALGVSIAPRQFADRSDVPRPTGCKLAPRSVG